MMKTKFSSRVIALILTLGMLITCLPTMTFAEDAVAQTTNGVEPRVDLDIEKVDDLRAYLTEWSKQLYIDITTTPTAPSTVDVDVDANRQAVYSAYSSYGIFQRSSRPYKVILDDENKMVAFDETGLQAYLDAVSGYNVYKNNIPVVDDRTLVIRDYEPFAENSKAVRLSSPASLRRVGTVSQFHHILSLANCH